MSVMSVMRAEDGSMRSLATRLDPREFPPLRRGPLSHRTREPRMPWSMRARVLVRLVIVMVVLAGVIWAGSL